MIAAVSENGIIGVDGGMPWYIPSDFAHFKRITMGKPIIMGRKQFESVGKPLPGRVNIVISRRSGYQPEGVIVVNEFEDAIAQAKSIALADGVGEIMIIGGGEIYELGMKIAQRLYISHVDKNVTCESETELVRFPEILPGIWNVEEELDVEASLSDEAAYSIKVYTRIGPLAH
ncbi:MAG TPA: dihydrofolate reductase [Devosia sp.]|nr:dihydrofolate reductase [Devosia sp.]